MHEFILKALTGYLIANAFFILMRVVYPVKVRKKMTKEQLDDYQKGLFYYGIACIISPWVFNFSF